MFDYRLCNFSAADQALCEYAIKLTIAPEQMVQADVARLHEAGFDDHQITLAAQVISYFNYINRIADGLDVELEDWMTLDVDDWKRQKPDWRKD